MKIHETLESIYSPLEEKRKELMQLLAKQYPAITWGWYSGHYHRTAEGWVRESYPIPVITIKGLCDIELSFREMTVTAKLPSPNAHTSSSVPPFQRGRLENGAYAEPLMFLEPW